MCHDRMDIVRIVTHITKRVGTSAPIVDELSLNPSVIVVLFYLQVSSFLSRFYVSLHVLNMILTNMSCKTNGYTWHIEW